MRSIELLYEPRSQFKEFHERGKRWACIVAHRRAGKTVACINELIERALYNKRTDPPSRYAYIAPFYAQAKQAAWDYLKQFSRPVAIKVSESELSVDLINNARIRLYGADNPDALRGIYLDGVILDEYADMRARVWGEVISPTLSDRRGWAVFIGTPRGHNAFYDIWKNAQVDNDWFALMLRASETGILSAEELASARKRSSSEDQYTQEYECSFEAAVLGAIYAKEIAQARTDKRICNVPYERLIRVSTYWDLGIGDLNAIWFVQQVGQEIRLIDYYENSGQGLDHYFQVLDKKGYLYDRHVAPHDIEVRELGSGKSRLEIARELGINFEIAPKLDVEDGINAARLMFSKCWFDETKCEAGLEALMNYRRDYNQTLDEVKAKPLHDWASHGADAFRYFAVSHRKTEKSKKINYPPLGIV